MSQKVSNWAAKLQRELDAILKQPPSPERAQQLAVWRAKLSKGEKA